MIISITGHRPADLGGYEIPNPVYDNVRKLLTEKFKELNPQMVISGMALGADQWAAYVAIELCIPFTAAVPCDNQDSRWPADSRKQYQELLGLAAKVVVVSPGPYAAYKMHKRSQWMVDNSDVLVAIWTGKQHGGTFSCVQYAKSQNKDIHIINPI